MTKRMPCGFIVTLQQMLLSGFAVVALTKNGLAYDYTIATSQDTLNGGSVSVSGFGLTLSSAASSALSHAVGEVDINFTGPVYPTEVYYTVSLPSDARFTFASIHIPGQQEPIFGDACFPTACPRSGKGVIGASTSLAVSGSLWSYYASSARIFVSLGGSVGDPERYDDDDYQPGSSSRDQGQEPNSVAGGYLTSSDLPVPVFQEHGYTDFVWARSTTSTVGSAPSGWNPAYVFESDIPFTQFLIPAALPGGDDTFQLVFGSYESHTIHAGVPFDFTTLAPGGVEAFVLTGFNASEGLLAGQDFPYTHGFRFAAEGPTLVREGPLSPGDYTLGGLVNGDDYNLWRTNFGTTGDNQADGNNDGVVDAADYVLWRRFQTATSASGAMFSAPAVPEPSSLVLQLAALAAICIYRSQWRRTNFRFGSCNP